MSDDLMQGRRRSFGLLLAGAAIILTTAPAAAQNAGVIVMRKAIVSRLDSGLTVKPPVPTNPTPTPTPNPSDPSDPNFYSWTVTSWAESAGSCGSQGTETREVACKNSEGLVAADARCAGNGSGPKPIVSRPATITASCGYSWQSPTWPTPAGSCGDVAQKRDAICLRSDGTASDRCSPATKPATERSVYDTSGCGFAWSASSWSAPTTTCGTATQTRSIDCRRTDGETADETKCVGAKPETEQTTEQTSGCATLWKIGDWNAPAACGAVTQSRSVTCQRANGTAVPDAQCADPKPETTHGDVDYSICPPSAYSWKTGVYGSPTTTCGLATVTRTVQCAFEDGSVAEDAKCSGTRPETTTQQTITSSCTYSWQTDAEFGAPLPACGATVRARGVRCMRGDGKVALNGQCDDATRPADTTPATDYSACGFGWTATAWSDLSSTCGAATQSRTVSCQRSDGSPADAAQCDAQAKPAATQSSYQTTGCGLTWQTGDWAAVAPACGASTQTRSVSCLRSDGETVTDDQCAIIGARPDETRAATDHSTCSFSWDAGSYSAPSKTCGTTTQTRTVTCLRSDGQNVDESACSAAGTKPATSETTTQTGGCTYAWNAVPWDAAAPACGASTHSRTVSCTRSDGTVVDPAACVGDKPATSEATQDYSTCSYAWQVSQWKGSSTVCGDTVQQTRDVTCQRSTQTTVPDANCSATRPAATQTVSDFSGCGYAWKTTSSAWSSTCSSEAVRSNASSCIRTDGATVDDSFCGTKPAEIETKPIYSSCTYTPFYGAPYGTCAAASSTRTTTLVKCMRSDQTDVTSENATAGYAYCAASYSQACTPTYTPSYGSYGTCTPSSQGSTAGTQSAPMTSCTANDGTNATLAKCSASQPTTSRSCTITKFTPTYDAYGTCVSSSQNAPIATCSATSSDGTSGQISTSLCPVAMQSETRTCTGQARTCGTLTVNTYLTGATVKIADGITTKAAAQTSCNGYFTNVSTTGACLWNSTNQVTYYAAGGTTIARTQDNLYAAMCQ